MFLSTFLTLIEHMEFAGLCLALDMNVLRIIVTVVFMIFPSIKLL